MFLLQVNALKVDFSQIFHYFTLDRIEKAIWLVESLPNDFTTLATQGLGRLQFQ